MCLLSYREEGSRRLRKRWRAALLVVTLQTTAPDHAPQGETLPAPIFAAELPLLWQQLRGTLTAPPESGHTCTTGSLDTLVLEGGGVKGIAYSGAACALEAAGLLDDVNSFRGTSAGAIAAALLASGMGCESMHTALWSIDFDALVSGSILTSLEQLRTSFGLHDGRNLQRHIESLLAAQVGTGNITFAELRELTGKQLQLTATSLTTSRLVYFDADRTPNVPVARAVRASASIPLSFVCTHDHRQ